MFCNLIQHIIKRLNTFQLPQGAPEICHIPHKHKYHKQAAGSLLWQWLTGEVEGQGHEGVYLLPSGLLCGRRLEEPEGVFQTLYIRGVFMNQEHLLDCGWKETKTAGTTYSSTFGDKHKNYIQSGSQNQYKMLLKQTLII